MSLTADLERDGFRAARSPFIWLLEREIVRYLKMWYHSLFGAIVAALLLLLVFGWALGHRALGAHGVPYVRFIMPGLVGQAILTGCYGNGSTTLFEARRDHYINDVLASPLRWWEINAAVVIAGMTRGFLTGAGVAAVAMPATGTGVSNAPVLILGLIAALIVSAQFGVIAGIYVRNMDHVAFVQSIVLQPITFLGGTFYSLSQLPHAWRIVTQCNPMFYIVQVLRIGFIGRADIAPWVGLAVLWGLVIAMSGWSLLLFRSARRLKS